MASNCVRYLLRCAQPYQPHLRPSVFLLIGLLTPSAYAAPTGPVQSTKGAVATSSKPASVVTPHQTAQTVPMPASASGYSIPSQVLIDRTRREFDKLGLQMIGTTRIAGESSVFLKYRGLNQQQIFGVGQVIGGFRIISIQNDYTVFEGNGVRLWLALSQKGEDTPLPRVEPIVAKPAPAPAGSEIDLEPFTPVRHKESAVGMKRKTRDFAQAIVASDQSEPLATMAEKAESNAKVTEVAEASTSQKLKFIMPITGRLTSGFGYRKRPTGGARRYHQGVDIQAPLGTQIRAAASGVVKEVSRSWAKGLNILIQHADGYETAYFHLSKALVEKGQRVVQGQFIGKEGLTGITTGPHLHFEIHKGGRAVDPALYLKELAGR